MEKLQHTIEQWIQKETSISESIPWNYDLTLNGILDSISTLKLITWLESTFGISFKPHEITKENLATIDAIVHIVNAKRSA